MGLPQQEGLGPWESRQPCGSAYKLKGNKKSEWKWGLC